MNKRAFGQLELDILNILKSGERMTVKEVHQLLGGDDKYNTIMTVMLRLSLKKQLVREKVGLQYHYWMVPAERNSPSLLEQFKKKLFGVKTTAVVSYLIESANDISDEDLLEMERMIKSAKEKRKSS